MRRELRLTTSTCAMAIAVAVLAAYVYVEEVRGYNREERKKESAARLLPFSADSATEVQLQSAGVTTICRKVNGSWRIVAPIQATADEQTIVQLLQDIERARIERTLPRTAEVQAAYGFEKPVSLAVSTPNKQASFEVGKLNSTGEFVFVRAQNPGSHVSLVDRQLQRASEKSLYDLREKAVFAVAPEDVVSIEFDSRRQHVRLVRSPADSENSVAGWRMEKPIHAQADRGLINRSLDLVCSLRAESFVNENQVEVKRFGLADPAARVRFTYKNGTADSLLIGRKTTEGALTRWYACRPGQGPVFTINDNLPGDAQRPFMEWRDRHAVDFLRQDVAELRLISPVRTVVAAKVEDPKGEEWRLAEFAGQVAEGMNLGAGARMPSATRADRDHIEEIIGHLATLEAKKFMDSAKESEARLGLTKPAFKVAALNKAGKLLASVSFGARNGPDFYATGPHLGVVFSVSAADADRFRLRAENLAAR